MSWSAELTWSVEWDERARRELRHLDPAVQRRILGYLRQRIAGPEDPRQFGRPLSGGSHGLWRYRIGAYRLVCRIEPERHVVLVLAVGHRKEVYE
jgi:mRNA interferase RelE/StbE